MRSLFLLGSSEPRAEDGGADEINRANEVVGEHAECCFPADFLEASSEESAAGCHWLDGSERMFAGTWRRLTEPDRPGNGRSFVRAHPHADGD